MRILITRTQFILAALFTTLQGVGYAQKIADEDSYTIEINRRNEIIKCSILKKQPGNFSPKFNHVYYWYTNNEIHSSDGGVGGKLLHGTYTSYYNDMSLKESGSFYKGQKQGSWLEWYPSGNVHVKSKWSNGLLNGKTVEYSETKKEWTSSLYVCGELNGVQKKYERGKCIQTVKYKNGEIIPPHSAKKNKQTPPKKNGKIKNTKANPKKEFNLKSWFNKTFSKNKEKKAKDKSQNKTPKKHQK